MASCCSAGEPWVRAWRTLRMSLTVGGYGVLGRGEGRSLTWMLHAGFFGCAWELGDTGLKMGRFGQEMKGPAS